MNITTVRMTLIMVIGSKAIVDLGRGKASAVITCFSILYLNSILHRPNDRWGHVADIGDFILLFRSCEQRSIFDLCSGTVERRICMCWFPLLKLTGSVFVARTIRPTHTKNQRTYRFKFSRPHHKSHTHWSLAGCCLTIARFLLSPLFLPYCEPLKVLAKTWFICFLSIQKDCWLESVPVGFHEETIKEQLLIQKLVLN